MPMLYQKGVLGLALASHLPSVLAVPTQLVPKGEDFVLGAVGDSWASGVSYNLRGETDYDYNKDRCLRVNRAYAVKVADDKSWLPEGKELKFNFKSCSGSKIEHLFSESWLQGAPQIDLLERNHTTLMQAGDNNADFRDVGNNCLYHIDVEPSEPYPNPAGECARAIDRTRRRIETDDFDGIEAHITKAIHAWRNSKATQGMDAKLYVIGYAKFFAHAEWCNDFSFGVNLENRHKLTSEVRKAINDLTDLLNEKINNAVKSFGDSNIQFVDVDPKFDGSRFCEDGHTGMDQYFGDKVNFWNFLPEAVFTLNDEGNDFKDVPQMTEEEFNEWHEKSMSKFTDDSNEVTPMMTTDATDEFKTKWCWPGPVNGRDWLGFMLRPFRPKEGGHKLIADAIIEHLKKNFKDAQEPPPPPPKEGKILWVGLEQNTEWENLFPNLINRTDNTWIFWTTENGQEPDSLCYSELKDFHRDEARKFTKDCSVGSGVVPWLHASEAFWQ